MSSIFTRIIKGEIPCYKVAENQNHLAFLDIRPLTKGHTLVVPKKEIDYLFDLDNDTYTGLMLFAKQVAIAMKQVISCERIGVVVMGTEVPHAHVHLIPFWEISDMNFTNPKLQLTTEEMQAIATTIYQSFNSIVK
jgi:histidine triad (HIT) family protein